MAHTWLVIDQSCFRRFLVVAAMHQALDRFHNALVLMLDWGLHTALA